MSQKTIYKSASVFAKKWKFGQLWACVILVLNFRSVQYCRLLSMFVDNFFIFILFGNFLRACKIIANYQRFYFFLNELLLSNINLGTMEIEKKFNFVFEILRWFCLWPQNIRIIKALFRGTFSRLRHCSLIYSILYTPKVHFYHSQEPSFFIYSSTLFHLSRVGIISIINNNRKLIFFSLINDTL